MNYCVTTAEGIVVSTEKNFYCENSENSFIDI